MRNLILSLTLSTLSIASAQQSNCTAHPPVEGEGGEGTSYTQCPPPAPPPSAPASSHDTPASKAEPAGKPVFPAQYPLNQSIAELPVNARRVIGNFSTGQTEKINDRFHSVFGAGHIHMDLSIPYNVVDSNAHPEILAPVHITLYAGDSDSAVTMPVVSQTVEGGLTNASNNDGNDHHLLVYDIATGILHEFYRFALDGNSYSAQSYTQWLGPKKVTTRTIGKTSADAAGLAITPWLLQYDEAASGTINHSLRVTMSLTRAGGNAGYMVPPATHASGNNYGSPIAVGHRIRLRSDFNVSGYSTTNQAILNCLKTYGAVIADNGSSFYINGTPDARWNDDDLKKLGTVSGNDFNVVDTGDMVDINGTVAK